MPDITRKHVAPQYRVLVSAKTFLNPTFPDSVVFLTGGHIELLRNLMQYANRRTTWVSDYYIGYYLSPDDFNWDLIQERVAELEYRLMGNNNVIWGYVDRYADILAETSMPAGISNIYGATVPEGEVWEVTGLSFTALGGTCDRIRAGFETAGGQVIVIEKLLPVADVMYNYNVDMILKEGDKVYFRFYGMTLNDDVYAYAWGSKMEVPT